MPDPEGVWVDGRLMMADDIADQKVAVITILCPMPSEADDLDALALGDFIEALALQPSHVDPSVFKAAGRVTDARLRAMTLTDLAELTPARATPR